MAYVVADRVKQKTTSSGTGTITLGSSVVGFQSFSAVASTGDTFHYALVHLTDGSWETGIGTYNSGTGTVARSVQRSSNSNNLVDFATGDKEIFITPTAANLVYENDTGAVNVVRTAIIDFGNTMPQWSNTFTISDAAAITTSRIVVVPSSNATSAFGGDELEMDNFSVSAQCLTNGVITVSVTPQPGPMQGKRNFNYIIGSGAL